MPQPITTADALLNGRVRLAQPASGYRAGVDAVLLAAAVPAAKGETAIDCGAGVGAAALCLAARVAGVAVTGLEIDDAHVALAQRNAADSGVADRVGFLAADLLARPEVPPADHVLTNPPYLRLGHTITPLDAARARANVAGAGGLAAWLAACLRLLKPGGTLTLIYRADGLSDALAALPGCGAIEVIPLWPRAGEPAKRIILRARKGSRAALVLHAGLVLHELDGRYTPATDAILRHAAPLPARRLAAPLPEGGSQ
jgi:tRNA1(Val) A37 N6-methylase TrmN6